MRVWIEIIIATNSGIYIAFHPLMRVWIEIVMSSSFNSPLTVSPSYEGVDWNCLACFSNFFWCVSPSYEGVDWNTISPLIKNRVGHGFTLLWGCGLKSTYNYFLVYVITFHPLMRVWIEIETTNTTNIFWWSFTLLWGCGLKLYHLLKCR